MVESDYLGEDAETLGRLSKLPIFNLLDGPRVSKVVGFCKIRRYDQGETLIQEGDTDRALFILLSGSARVLKKKKKICDLQRFGDIFGEVNLVDGHGRSATVRANSAVLCLVVDAARLETLSSDDVVFFHALMYRALAEILSRKLRETSDDVASLKANHFFC
ncbi:MAG: cyclic nucleotide-binding domain-containing protein [Desulfovibrio aminophilus]|uniref:cyclic nucleotide-binding domain-containing protein n=1 Tax=Desulfovibrio aminophilus TaxID=81425 RepID=UPI0039E795FB